MFLWVVCNAGHVAFAACTSCLCEGSYVTFVALVGVTPQLGLKVCRSVAMIGFSIQAMSMPVHNHGLRGVLCCGLAKEMQWAAGPPGLHSDSRPAAVPCPCCALLLHGVLCGCVFQACLKAAVDYSSAPTSMFSYGQRRCITLPVPHHFCAGCTLLFSPALFGLYHQ